MALLSDQPSLFLEIHTSVTALHLHVIRLNIRKPERMFNNVSRKIQIYTLHGYFHKPIIVVHGCEYVPELIVNIFRATYDASQWSLK